MRALPRLMCQNGHRNHPFRNMVKLVRRCGGRLGNDRKQQETAYNTKKRYCQRVRTLTLPLRYRAKYQYKQTLYLPIGKRRIDRVEPIVGQELWTQTRSRLSLMLR
jgi:hypothetical protein